MNKREIFDVVHEYKKLKDRIDKTIEYIEKHKYCETSEYNDNYKEIVVNANELLDILKGVDKECK